MFRGWEHPWEHPWRSNFIKIALWHGCSPVNLLLYIFKTSFYENTSGGLLLLLTCNARGVFRTLINVYDGEFLMFFSFNDFTTRKKQEFPLLAENLAMILSHVFHLEFSVEIYFCFSWFFFFLTWFFLIRLLGVRNNTGLVAACDNHWFTPS